MKRKLKRKVLWLDEWNIEEQEAWFSDMAAQGWQLIKIGKVFATFEQSTPQELEYRCDIFNLNDRSDKNKINFYQESGWEHVASRRYIQVFKEVEAGKSSEIHTDPVEQAATLEILNRSIKSRGLITLVFTVALILLAAFMLLNNPLRNYLDNEFILPLMLIIIYFYIAFIMIGGMIHMSKLIKKLESHRPLSHKVNYKIKMGIKRSVGISVIFILILWNIFVFSDLIPSISMDRHPEIPGEELPVVQISDIMNESEYQQAVIPDDYTKYDNYYTEKSSILVPKQFELNQKIEVPGILWEDGSGTYSPSIRSYSYEVRNEWFAKRFIRNLKDWYEFDYLSYEYLAYNGLDELWVREEDAYATLIARRGNKVYQVNYYGIEPMEKIIEAVLTKHLSQN